MSLLWTIVRQAIKRRAQTAVIDDRGSHSYAKLLGAAMFIAERIEKLTDRPHIGVMVPTSAAFPMALLAGWLARRTVVPLNYLLAKDELAYVIHDSEIDTILTAQPMLDFLGAGLELPAGVRAVKMEDFDYTGIPPLRWPPLAARRDLAVILYTSGTSGKPKGVMLTHGNLEHNVHAAIQHAGITSANAFLGVLPQFHSFGLTGLTLIPLVAGSRVIYTARFVPRRVISLIARHQPDIMMAVPSMYNGLLTVKDVNAEDMASVRLAISGGEPLMRETAAQFQERFNVRILEGYGLTETAPVTHWSNPNAWRQGAVGRALPDVTTVIVDAQDRPLPVGQEGEILLHGPNIMPGYFKLPDITRAAFVDLDLPTRWRDPDSSGTTARFFRTGDIGKVDAEGFLYITGRKKEMLIIAGENVFPREIEEVLNRHPAVRDSAVIGRLDDLRGELPIAFVELHDGQTLDETSLRALCRENLAGYKVPREIHRLDTLPRSPTGKVLRRKLKDVMPAAT